MMSVARWCFCVLTVSACEESPALKITVQSGSRQWSITLDDGPHPTSSQKGKSPCHPPVSVRIERAVDGDTLKVNGLPPSLSDRVRLIGIDTPELRRGSRGPQCFALEAAKEARKLEGLHGTLTFEKQCKDKYGRTLAHLAPRGHGGELFAARLLRRGLARTLSIAPNRQFQKRFQSLEAEAKREERGLWGRCTG